MPALISFILPLLPYIAVVGIVAFLYFKIRRNATRRAKEKYQAAQAKLAAAQREKLNAAQSKDEAIDRKVEAQINELKKPSAPGSLTPDDKFKF